MWEKVTGWIAGLEPAQQVVLVAASATVLAAVITFTGTATSVLLKNWLDHRAEKARMSQTELSTYRRYSEPLLQVAVSLLWRFEELFAGDGSSYLGSSESATEYERYKALSTQYRIGALLGWMAALDRELLLHDDKRDRSVEPMRSALDSVRTALADGGHVEVTRVDRLARIWELELSEPQAAALCSPVDRVIDRLLTERGSSTTVTLTLDGQVALATQVSSCVSDRAGVTVDSGLVAATAAELAEAFDIHEAWIYRDWQRAIGDLMLVPVIDGPRRFEVMGYGDFESLWVERADAASASLARLTALTDRLDLGGVPEADARIGQLQAVRQAVAELIVEFHMSNRRRSTVSDGTLATARALLESKLMKAS